VSGEETLYTKTWFHHTRTQPDQAYMAVLSTDLQMSSLGNTHSQDLKHLHILTLARFTGYRKTHGYSCTA
jgi:hypothetical protein